MPDFTITVDQGDIDRLERKLMTLTRPAAERIVERAARFAEVEAKSGAQDAAVARMIMVEGRGMEARVTSPVAASLESGDIGSLREWAQAHGIAEFLYPLARALRRRGVRGRFFMLKTLDKLRNSELPRLLRQAGDEIEAGWRS